MRDLRTNEVAAVSGGTFGLLFGLFSCFKPKPVYCAPAPKPEPKCDPAPKCDPKPKKRGC